MTPVEELRDLGLHFDPAPPLMDSRRPLAMVFRELPDGTFWAAAVLEIERFRIQPPSEIHPIQEPGYRRAWINAAETLLALAATREIWHVLATRRPPGPD